MSQRDVAALAARLPGPPAPHAEGDRNPAALAGRHPHRGGDLLILILNYVDNVRPVSRQNVDEGSGNSFSQRLIYAFIFFGHSKNDDEIIRAGHVVNMRDAGIVKQLPVGVVAGLIEVLPTSMDKSESMHKNRK